MGIEISREDVLLDTGGGLKKAAHFFLQDSSGPEEPFIVHNVDVLSTIDLLSIARFHKENQALATLAVQDRKTSRYLLFDRQHQLGGRQIGANQPELVRGCREVQALGFSGIQVVSPRLLKMMIEDGAFSIITAYLRLAAQGEKILAFRADQYYWRDLGNPESVAQAAEDLKQNVIAP
jgi:NDP-sugar pyrophosphorylase family protein